MLQWTVRDIVLCAITVSPWQVLLGFYWHLTKRKVRARNVLLAAAIRSPRYYRNWIRKSEPAIIARFHEDIERSHVPVIAVITGDDETSNDLAGSSIASLRSAFGDAVTIYCDDAEDMAARPIPSSLPALLDTHEGCDAWLLPLMPGDRISASTGRVMAAAVEDGSVPPILYWDEDRQDGGERRDPFLKPDWDDLLFLSRDIMTGSCAISLDALRAISPDLDDRAISADSLADAVVAIASHVTRGAFPAPGHIPLILSHRQRPHDFGPPSARWQSLEARWPASLELSDTPDPSSPAKARHSLPAALPSISIIIPTRDRGELLRTCHEGIRQTEYAGPIEIIVVDNGSRDAETLAYLELMEAQGALVLRHSGPFNFSTLNNLAAKTASGEFLCLMNNDLEMIDDCWLSHMVRQGIRPGVGAVGARLLYPDRSIQHAGVAIGVGNAAGHIFRGVHEDGAGHHWLHRTTRHLSAVTAACLLVRRSDYWAVGGLNEDRFAVAFNDVDLCLKLGALGRRNVFAADACLIHHESKSRGNDHAKENIDRFRAELAALQDMWGTETAIDPFHHPLLLRSSETYVLAP